MKYDIKSRFSDAVIYSVDIPDDTPSGMQARVALEKAATARAYLKETSAA